MGRENRGYIPGSSKKRARNAGCIHVASGTPCGEARPRSLQHRRHGAPLAAKDVRCFPTVAGYTATMLCFLVVGPHALLTGADFNASDLARQLLALHVRYDDFSPGTLEGCLRIELAQQLLAHMEFFRERFLHARVA